MKTGWYLDVWLFVIWFPILYRKIQLAGNVERSCAQSLFYGQCSIGFDHFISSCNVSFIQLGYYSLSTYSGFGGGEKYSQNPFWGPRKPSQPFLTMSDTYVFSFHFFPSVWYGPKSLQFDQSAQFGSGLDMFEWGLRLGHNSVMPKYKASHCWGNKKMFFFEPVDRESKVA